MCVSSQLRSNVLKQIYLFLFDRLILQRGEIEIFHLLASVARIELIQSQKSVDYFRSPMWVLGPKALDHLLLFQYTGRKLN